MHITIVCFSLYVHRGMAHQQYKIHPILSNFMRYWLWLFDGTGVKEWAAIHREHHAYADTPKDPHFIFYDGTPLKRIKSIIVICLKSIFKGYRGFATDTQMNKVGHVPYGWIDRHLRLGTYIVLLLNLYLFGWAGFIVWLIQISWVTVCMTAIIAIGGHMIGYHGEWSDNSRNLFPIGIIASGEEMHHNHHREPTNSNLRRKWYEFDIGYMYLKFFSFLGLIEFKTHYINKQQQTF
jgi:stearoyl-CoA desaturase (delta-9 desaturase)